LFPRCHSQRCIWQLNRPRPAREAQVKVQAEAKETELEDGLEVGVLLLEVERARSVVLRPHAVLEGEARLEAARSQSVRRRPQAVLRLQQLMPRSSQAINNNNNNYNYTGPGSSIINNNTITQVIARDQLVDDWEIIEKGESSLLSC